MKNIIILNGSSEYLHAKGRLGKDLCDIAKNELEKLGFNVDYTDIAKGYDIQAEIQKLLKADCWIWQIPGWWMAEPWYVKKYIDEVFTESKGALYVNDGRSSKDASKQYGSGGLANSKYYMFSFTWNLPLSAFSNEGFFEGRDIDELCFHLHKTFQFLGMKALPTYMCNDVIKNPDFDKYHNNYKEHIAKVFAEFRA